MGSNIAGLMQIIIDYGIITSIIVILIFIIGLLIFNPLLSEKIRAYSFLLLYKLSGKTEHEKKFIKGHIRSSLNLARLKLHKHVSFLPELADIEWIKNENGNISDITERKFIIKLDPSKDQAKNIVLMAEAIVRRTTLNGIRYSVSKPLEDAIDGNLVKNLLISTNNKNIYDWYIRNDYKDLIERSHEHQTRNSQITEMDERGLFTRILLVELEDFSKEVFGLAPKPYIADQIEKLVEFVYDIATKKYDEDAPLTLKRVNITIGVVIVAKTDKILESIIPYFDAFKYHLQNGFKSIYLLAFDKEWLGERDIKKYRVFLSQIENLTKKIEKELTCYKYFEEKYKCRDINGDIRNATCLRYVAPKIND